MLSAEQFSGPYSNWESDPTFAPTRKYSGSLADAPPFPKRMVEGKWTTEKSNAIAQEVGEWRDQYGGRVPTGPVHPNSTQRMRSGTTRAYVPEYVRATSPVVSEVDPRTLHGIQPGVHQQGVEHYLTDEYGKTGRTFEETKGVVGTESNRMPTVYQREDGMNVVLAGHHRAAAALAQGRPLVARTLPNAPVPT